MEEKEPPERGLVVRGDDAMAPSDAVWDAAKIALVTGVSLFTAVVLLLLDATGAAPFLTPVATGVAGVGSTLVRRLRRRLPRLEEGYAGAVAASGQSLEDAVRDLQRRMQEDEDFEEDVSELLGRALRDLDPAINPAAGRLLHFHQYDTLIAADGSRKPRRLFRGTGMLLLELDADQFKTLQRIIGLAAAEKEGQVVLATHATGMGPEGITLAKLLLHHDLVDQSTEAVQSGGVTLVAPKVRIHVDVAKALNRVVNGG
jgi:hypothetical protein